MAHENENVTPEATEAAAHIVLGAASWLNRDESVTDEGGYHPTLGQFVGVAVELPNGSVITSNYEVPFDGRGNNYTPNRGALRAAIYALTRVIPADRRKGLSVTVMLDRADAVTSIENVDVPGSIPNKDLARQLKQVTGQYHSVRFRSGNSLTSPVTALATDMAKAAMEDEAVLGTDTMSADDYADFKTSLSERAAESSPLSADDLWAAALSM